MSDSAANGNLHHARREKGAEYYVYFALIVVLGLVPHMVGWLYQVIRHAKLPRLGPLARVLKDAQALTPMIFRG